MRTGEADPARSGDNIAAHILQGSKKHHFYIQYLQMYICIPILMMNFIRLCLIPEECVETLAITSCC